MNLVNNSNTTQQPCQPIYHDVEKKIINMIACEDGAIDCIVCELLPTDDIIEESADGYRFPSVFIGNDGIVRHDRGGEESVVSYVARLHDSPSEWIMQRVTGLLREYGTEGASEIMDELITLQDIESVRRQTALRGKPVPGETGLVYGAGGYSIDPRLETGSREWAAADLRLVQIEGGDMAQAIKFHERVRNDIDMEGTRDAVLQGAKLPTVSGGVPMPASWKFRPSDLSNTEIFAALAHGRVLFIPEFKTWHYWNGQRWQADPQKIEVEKIVIETIQSIYALSADAETEGERKMYAAWALRSEDEARRRAIVSGAERCAVLVKPISNFDQDIFLFNCDNGTLDLRTGELRPHSPHDYISKISPVTFDYAARCPLWLDTLHTAMRGSTETIEFLQTFLGYALTGDTREHAAIFMYGNSGANGKSTITTAVYEIMGDYARKIGITSLLSGVRRSPGGPSEDIARLAGIRFVLASEPPEKGRFDDALLKDLTGGDPMNARHLQARSFDFKPNLKLCIFGNHKPSLRGGDGAVRRRLRLIPFLHKFTNPDRDMPNKLRDEYSGVLNWLTEGCIRWQSFGLGEPATVKAATDEYFYDNDVFRQFIDQGYILDTEGRMLFSDFYSAFVDFTGTSKLSKPRFSVMIRDELGLDVVPGGKNKKYIIGIREAGATDTPEHCNNEDGELISFM